MIFSITNQGQVRFMFYRDNMNSKRLIEFMRRLTKDAGRKVFLTLDNLKVHHGKAVKAWLEKHQAIIEVLYLIFALLQRFRSSLHSLGHTVGRQ